MGEVSEGVSGRGSGTAELALQMAIIEGNIPRLELLLSRRLCDVEVDSLVCGSRSDVDFAREFARLVGRWVSEETVAAALPQFFVYNEVDGGNSRELVQEYLVEHFDFAAVDLEQTLEVYLGECAYIPFDEEDEEDEYVPVEGYGTPLVKHVITGSARTRLQARREPWTPDTHRAHSAPTRARLRSALIALTLPGHLPSSVVIEHILPRCVHGSFASVA